MHALTVGTKKRCENKKLQEEWEGLKRDVFAVYESIFKGKSTVRSKQGQKKAKDEKK